MNMPVRFGIIGCSDISKRITIPSMLDAENAVPVMVGSRSQEKAKMFGKEFGIDKYGSYDDVINSSNLDAVYISLPPSMQAEWAIKAAKMGKHILCEKSAATSFIEATNVVDISKKNNVRILEAFSFRFHIQHRKFKELIENDVAGKIHVFEGRFGLMRDDFTGFRFDKDLGGGALNDAGCYPVCASRMILEEEPVGVSSTLRYDDKKGVDIQGSFYFIYPKNKCAFGSFGYYNSYQSTYSVWGSKSMMGLKRAYAIKPNTDSVIWINSDDGYKEIEVPWVNQSKLMIEEFSRSIQAGSGIFNYENDLLMQAKSMEAIRISNQEKRFVMLDEITS